MHQKQEARNTSQKLISKVSSKNKNSKIIASNTTCVIQSDRNKLKEIWVEKIGCDWKCFIY